MDKEQARQLLIRYDAGQCSEEEKTLVDAWYFQLEEQPIALSEKRITTIGEEILKRIQSEEVKSKRTKLWTALITTAAVMTIAIASWQFLTPKSPQSKALAYKILPGTNKATITLANGGTINLDSNQTGVVISADKIAYTNGAAIPTANPTGIQTISTPRGGEYQILLPDGTKVWLNAATSLTYPSKFSGSERRVKLTGEAYFEVAHNNSQPFLVETKEQTVRVLGTHFNINSYSDEPASITTLEQGAVKVILHSPSNEPTKSIVLSPGERSVAKAGELTQEKADLETDLAWKNGNMEFRNASLQAILREVSRWYDIDILYKGEIKQRIFSGTISRKSDLSALLKILELSKIHYQLSDAKAPKKQLTILPLPETY